jgi:hypothetical protein
MKKSLQHVFHEAVLNPESGLSERIWHRIIILQRRRVRLQMWAYSSISVLSFATLFPVIHDVAIQFAQSGFSAYVSLAFSDSAFVSMYWKDMIFSIADAIPAMSLIIVCALVFVFLVSLKRFARRLQASSLLAAV